MKYNVEKPEVVSSESLESVEIHLGETNVIFDLLRKQYTYPIQTPVQEAVCNARDSHRKAKQKRKIEIKLPSATYPFFSVRDFGTSMSDEDFSQTWAGMGNSTKRDSDEFTGGFGIGSKAWFAYRNNWFYKIYYNGKVKTYEVTTAKVYSGSAELRDVSDSDEPQGIEVIVPIKPNDVYQFEKAFYRATYFWKEEERPLIVNRVAEEISDIWLNRYTGTKLNDEIELIPKDIISAFSNNYDSTQNFVLAIDGVPYIVQAPLLNNAIRHDAYNSSTLRHGTAEYTITETLRENSKEFQPLCDILRTAYVNKDKNSKVPVFHIKVGIIKLVNHRESIDFGEDNINAVIKLLKERKIKLDKLILNTCTELLVNNNYRKAFDFCSDWQKTWLLTNSSTDQYANLFPYPFKYNSVTIDSYGSSKNWSWIRTDPAVNQSNAIYSYHKRQGYIYQFDLNKGFNFSRKSVYVIKDDTQKEEIRIKKKLNKEGVEDFFIIDLMLLPENIRDGFRDLCNNLTFGEWWIKTGLLDEEMKKPVKKDSSVISIHFLSEGKRDSLSAQFEKLKEDYRFSKTIFIKMKDNKPETDIISIHPLIDFIKKFFNKNVAMLTEANYKILSKRMPDDFIDFHDFLHELKEPSQDNYNKLEDLVIKSFLWKHYVHQNYKFKSLKYDRKAKSQYIVELTLYLMTKKINLNIVKETIANLEQFGFSLDKMNEVLLFISNPEPTLRKDYSSDVKTFDLIFAEDLLKLFPRINLCINTLELAYSQIESALCQEIPFLQYVASNTKSHYYEQQTPRGKEYEIHPIVIENLKKLELE